MRRAVNPTLYISGASVCQISRPKLPNHDTFMLIGRRVGAYTSLATIFCGFSLPASAAGLVPPINPACVSSPFGPRVLPGRPLAGTYHYGIDLPAAVGARVVAVAAGEVVSIHRRGAGGLEVALSHGNFITVYAHLGSVSPALAEGRRHVAAGEALGVVGRTGVSYGPHLYFELRIGGERVDPAPYLQLGRCA
jgi:murein DD-endopeptidase MepM/ murein hydrolase activator NlpD